MARKTPTREGRGVELLAGASSAPITTTAMQAQFIAARFGIPATMAALVAAHAFGGAYCGR